MWSGFGYPFRAGGLNLIADPPVYELGLTEFADMAYAFMTGIPSFGSQGFCMMGPDELRRQRVTYALYWLRKLNRDLSAVNQAAG